LEISIKGLWPRTLEQKNGTVFSYIMDNYDGDDERAYQGGVFTFHYTLSSTPEFNSSALARFGRESANPLEVKKIAPADKHGQPVEPLSTSAKGFIQIDSDDLILSTWKAAEDGSGDILRFYNTTDRPVSAHVRFPGLQFGSVYHVNDAEVNQAPIASAKNDISLSLGAHEIYSLRIEGFKLSGF
jgi:alpha-mannosidase